MVRSLAKRVLVALAFAGMIGGAALPLAAAAQDNAGTPTEVHFSTAITTAYGSPYPIAGHLDLEIFPSGILRGYYHNAYQKAFVPVVGGRDGSYIWFDIGPTLVDLGLGIAPNSTSKLHVVGTMGSDGGFKGQLYPLFSSGFVTTNVPGGLGQVDTTNTGLVPAPSPTTNDQYLFAAKPVDKSSEDYPFTSPSASPQP